MDTNTAIERFVPSTSNELSTSMLGIETSLEAAARHNVELAGEGFTNAEKEAMTAVEELRLLNGLDLTAVLLRGKILRRIEEQNLWSFHPERYETLEAMAEAQKISVSNLSNIRDLTQVVFPWLEAHGYSIPEVWENVGMTNFREILPVIKVLITGETSGTRTVQASVDAVLEDTRATLEASAAEGQTFTDEEIVNATIDNMIVAGGQMTSRALRATVRPVRTEPVTMFVLTDPVNNRRYVLAEADEGQITMLTRRFGSYVEPQNVTLPTSTAERQDFARRIRILQLITGQR